MKKSARVVTLLLVLIVLALSSLACASFGAQAPAPTAQPPEPSPTPPPIPTDIAVTEEAEPADSPEGEAEAPADGGAVSAASDDGVTVYSSLKDGTMGLYLLSPTGYYSTPIAIDDEAVEHAIWPSVSPDGSQLAFVSVEGSAAMRSRGIYVAGIDGSEAEQITFGDGTHPRWSPDGTQIAYTCSEGTDICVVGADGEGSVNLTEASAAVDMYPSWMPDGRIVFMSNRNAADGQSNDIFVMNADGTDLRALNSDPGNDAYPSVSPDGTKIAFVSDRDVAAGAEIYILEVSTTLVRQVTVDELWNQAPVWAPDNSTILFGAPDSTGSVNLYSIGERDISPVQLTENPAEDGGLRLGHSWLPSPVSMDDPVREAVYDVQVSLPEGSEAQTGRIVFVADDTGCTGCLESGMYVVDANGDNLEQLPIDGLYPVWSPDFERLAYVADGELWVANADGSDPTQVTHAFANLGAIDWDSRGDAIVAECVPYSQYDICLIEPQSGQLSNITGVMTPDTGVRYPYWWGDDIVAGTQIINQAGTVTASLAAEGRVAPGGRRLATVIDRQMAITDLDGDNATVLTSGPATKGFPVWSASGDAVLYTVAPGDGGLYLNVSQADGSGAFRLISEAIAAGPETRPETIETFLGYGWGE